MENEEEKLLRVFRVNARVDSINYKTKTLDYTPVDGVNRKFQNRYCKILNDQQLVTLYSALIHKRRVKLLINQKYTVDAEGTITARWDELSDLEEIWDK